MTSTAMNSPRVDRILRLREVCQITGLCRSNLYALQAQNRFPCRLKICGRAVGWLESEVVQWIVQRLGERNNTIHEDAPPYH